MSKHLSSIRTTIHIEAQLLHVWRVLTEPEFVRQWLGCLRYEKKLGHVFYMQQDAAKRASDDVDGATHCEIKLLKEPDRFVFSWYLPGTPETLVEISLSAAGESSTNVELIHSGWDKFEPEAIRSIREMLEGGWKSFVLPNLKRFVEQEK